MPSIAKKMINGRAYYYARECKRVGGKPKIVWQKYLGRADDIVRALSAAETLQPEQVDVIEYGLSAALYDVAGRLGVTSIIDSIASKRDQGLSVGQYMLLAAINRCTQPKSKNKIADWYASTVLRRLMPAPASALSSGRFWDNMGLLDGDKIRRIEEKLAEVVIRQEGVSLDCLLYDTTNFFTYIASETKGDLARRGRNKQKRNDLRQIGLALLVSRDFHVPILHEPYPGNMHDSAQFPHIIEGLTKRLSKLAGDCQGITLVFDKGNNSAENIKTAGCCHYVGSLVPSHHADLLSIPLTEYEDLPCGWKAYTARKKVFGKEHVICLAWSKSLADHQAQDIRSQLEMKQKKLDAISASLAARRKRPVKNGPKPRAAIVSRCVEQVVKGQHMKEIIRYAIRQDGDDVHFDYSLDETALLKIADRYFGKTILFTDREDMSAEAIITTYHALHKVEDAFKQMKDPHHVSFSPMYHWTDGKIRVHIFYCVLALILSSLLHRRLHGAGLTISPEEMHEQLSGIREVMLLYPSGKQSPRAITTLAKMSDIQYELIKVLDLSQYQS